MKQIARIVLLLALMTWHGTTGIAQQGVTGIAELRREMFQRHNAGRFAEALPLAERLLQLLATQYGTDSKEYAVGLYQLSNVLGSMHRYGEAVEQLRKARAILARDPADRIEFLQAEVVLATNLIYLSRLEEGVAMMRRATEEISQRLGTKHPITISSLNNLAQTLQSTGRAQEAEPILQRLIDSIDTSNPANFYQLGNLYANLAGVFMQTGRGEQGLEPMRKSVELFRRIGNQEHAYLATALNNLAQFESNAGRKAEAEALIREALGILERTLGRDNQAYATFQINLAVLLRDAGRPAEAEVVVREAASTLERTLGPDHPKTGSALNSLAVLLSARGEWAQARVLYRRIAAIAVRSARSVGLEEGQQLDQVFGLNAADFPGHLRAIFKLGADDPANLEEAFLVLQRHLGSRAAAAISRMAARAVAPDSALGRMVRQEQDLLRNRVALDQALVATIGQPGRDAERTRIRSELQRIDAELAGIAATLTQRFPDYAALAASEPIGLRDFQELLQRDEVFVTFVEVESNPSLRGESYVWAITRNRVMWRQLDSGARALGRQVPTPRCGLDATEWSRPDGAESCRRLTGVAFDPAGNSPPPFDTALAHHLYREMFEPVAPLLRSAAGSWRHVLVVASGRLAVLPLAALVTEPPPQPPAGGAVDLARVSWLGVRQPLTMLPSIGSLRALRALVKPSRATRPFMGFGNPLLEGSTGEDAERAKVARQRQACPQESVAAAAAPVAVAKRAGIVPLRRGASVDVGELRKSLAPLPETADELCAVARFVGAQPGDVHLAEAASEGRIKALSSSGQLAEARILHFATHGLLASETRAVGASEPALVLTPPATGSAADDGLLTATEIASLQLDADWVVLSACNTAADEAGGLESFSGLARAFFYAGARALLVSHWQVESAATVALVTKAFAELATSPGIGRAEAMRRAMAALVEQGRRRAHPATWAPFVVVGEGGMGR